MNKTVNLGSGISASLTGSLSNIRYDYNLDLQSNTVKSFYLKVNADSNLTAKISGSFSGTKSKEAKIASVPLKVGALSLHASIYATISVTGEISLSYKCDLGGGISYTKNGGWRTVKSFHSKGVSIESHASATLAVKAAVEARLAGTQKLAEIFIQAGVKANGNSKNRDDGTICSTVKAYLFAELGTKTILNELFDDPFTNTWQFINEGNSPVKLLKHWENGKLVSTCKYEKISYGSTGSAANSHSRNYGDYTKYGSNFEGLITSDEPVLQDYKINSDMSLNGDLTINGNAIITADVNLNGYTLTVKGNITQTGGGMSIGGGTLNVGGSYEISSDGYLYMCGDNGDEVNVSKDFIIKSSTCGYFRYGTLSIGGNFYQYIGGTTENNFVQEGTKVVFTGSGVHEAYFDSSKSYFTDISTSDGGKIKFTGEMHGFNLYNDLTIVGDTRLDCGTLNLNSHKLTIEGDFTQVDGIVNAYNNALTVTGKYILENGTLYSTSTKKSIISIGDSFEVKGGETNLGSLEVNVTGDVTQTGGGMSIGGGTLNVGGNYEISSDGYLYMCGDNGDEVNVSKDFIIKSSTCGYFRYGTLSIGGNFYQYIGGTTENNFVQEGTKVVFTGSGVHEVYFDSSKSYFTDISTSDGGKIKFTGEMHGFNLYNDLTIVGDTRLDCGTLNLNSHKLTIEGDFTQVDGIVNAYNNALTVTGKYILENGTLYSTSTKKSIISIGDSFELKGGEINLGSLEVNVIGDVTQTGGGMSIGGGTLNVSGNYEISSDGYLYMCNDNGEEVNISKDFIMKSSTCGYFRYGTLSIGGDFYQYIGGTTENNFVQEGTKIVFTGSGVHEVYFNSSKSYFTDIEMDNGSSISLDWGNKKLNILFADLSQIISISSNTVKALKVGNAKLTVNYSDGSKSNINIVVRESDNAAVTPKLPGDLNGDNKISAADIVLLQKYLTNKAMITENQWKAADLNSDGKVNVFDAVKLKKILLNI